MEAQEAPWWYAGFDDRQIQEIRFAQVYAERFGHGTSGHHRLLIIARLVEILERSRFGSEAERNRTVEMGG